MNEFVDQVRQRLIEFEVQIDVVFHVIIREDKPVRRLKSARLDQVFAQLDADQIAKPDGRKSLDRDRDRELGR